MKGYPAVLRKKYPTGGSLTEALSIPALIDIRRKNGISTLSDCVRLPFPTLKDIELSHGDVVAVGLIRILLINLNDSLNQNRMTDEQIYEAAHLMYEDGFHLKVTELYEFFVLVKKGKYGEYYGSLDVLKVMTDFRQFLGDRVDVMRRIEQQERQRKRNEEWEERDRMWRERNKK